MIGKDYKAYCQCPECRDKRKRPVCGSDGKTYPNECEVRRIACITATPIAVVKESKCGKSLFLKTADNHHRHNFSPLF